MATNDFLPFGGGAGSNVLTQAAYAALAARTAGFSSGVAKSAELNKVWRQSSIMSAVLAQLIADNTGADVVDDGTTATILANLKIATAGRLIGVQNFTFSGSYTYTPTAGTRSIIVEVQGAGGSGGGTAATSAGQAAVGGGGAAGAYSKGRFTSGFAGVTITVGLGGAQTAAGNNNGNAGATSSFGSLLTALGGGGGAGGGASSSFPFASAGGVGTGVPTGGVVNKAGSSAVQPIALLANVLVGSEGASSLFGRGGQSFSTSGNGGPGLSGAGGGGACAGASQPAFFGGNGGSGQVTIWEYA
ncbi:hypothetical protein N7403_30635 [Pseudomonas nitroreducens]|uniref:glycine-rich domain-containing protein n=1 Tax=Pseudomonas nitroreducens TaxID=46680 RepID=UPI00244AE48B|nr:hypothetical protein [Pseudomonas nitroreducens]MDG9858227.1 hypothetical protein [Pseudomonas nitroreducens]